MAGERLAFPDMIIYQFHVGTWWAEDVGGADVRAARYGTFLDAAQKLPYLQSLGINAVQPLPIQEFVTEFSWGYNGVDYFSPETEYVVPPADLAGWLPKINALYGRLGTAAALTIADLTPGINQLKCFIDLCHLHGIAVILDLVYNHAGGGFDPQSLFFFDHEQHINNTYSLYFTDQGWANGLIFAYWNNWVSQFLIDNARYFLTEYRIDGIRYDEVRVISNNGGQVFCRNLTDTVRATNPLPYKLPSIGTMTGPMRYSRRLVGWVLMRSWVMASAMLFAIFWARRPRVRMLQLLWVAQPPL